VPTLSVDDLTQHERLAASLTALGADSTLDRLTRRPLRTVRQAVEASLSAKEVETNTVDDDRMRELGPTLNANLHSRTIVLIP